MSQTDKTIVVEHIVLLHPNVPKNTKWLFEQSLNELMKLHYSLHKTKVRKF
jgi:hypothetical protein